MKGEIPNPKSEIRNKNYGFTLLNPNRRLGRPRPDSTGFTLMEILVVVSIVIIISVLFLFNYNSNKKKVELDNAALKVATLLRQAKQKTLASENSSTWGVHFTPSSITLFAGSQWQGSTNQIAYALADYLRLINNFTAGQDIIFSKISGYPNQTGTAIIYLADSSHYKIICLNGLGTVENNCPLFTSIPP